MNQTLTSILEIQGPQSLNISNQSFSEESIFEEFFKTFIKLWVFPGRSWMNFK